MQNNRDDYSNCNNQNTQTNAHRLSTPSATYSPILTTPTLFTYVVLSLQSEQNRRQRSMNSAQTSPLPRILSALSPVPLPFSPSFFTAHDNTDSISPSHRTHCRPSLPPAYSPSATPFPSADKTLLLQKSHLLFSPAASDLYSTSRFYTGSHLRKTEHAAVSSCVLNGHVCLCIQHPGLPHCACSTDTAPASLSLPLKAPHTRYTLPHSCHERILRVEEKHPCALTDQKDRQACVDASAAESECAFFLICATAIHSAFAFTQFTEETTSICIVGAETQRVHPTVLSSHMH